MGKTSRYHTVFTRRSQSHYFLITKPTFLTMTATFTYTLVLAAIYAGRKIYALRAPATA